MTDRAPTTSASPPVEQGMARHLSYCTRRFNELFEEHIGHRPQKIELTPSELREVIDACNAAVAPFGRSISDRRWIAYLDMLWDQSARSVVDREALKAVCILNNVIFIWDDLDPELQDLDTFLAETRKICDQYYDAEDAWWAYESTRAWATFEHRYRSSRLTQALCASLDHYFQFRLTDGAIDWWMKVSYPIYRDTQFTEHAKTGLAARLAVRSVIIVNDCYSHDREAELDEPANCFRLCDLHDDNAFHAFFEARLEDIRRDLACIKAFDDVTQHVLMDLIYGHLLWAATSERYQGAINPLNTPIR